MQTQVIGDIRIDRIVDMEGPFAELGFLIPDAPPDLIARHADWLKPRFIAPDDQVVMSFHSLLIRTPRRTILVDACIGNDKQRPERPAWHERRGPWLDNLRALGVAPEDIDLVTCTHLHADHVGWNTRLENGRWVPTFPNARYITSEIEYHHWQEMLNGAQDPLTVGHGCLQDSVLPVVDAGQMDLVHDGRELSHGLTLDLSAGHTPGHLSLDVRRKGNRGIFCGDVLHSPIQIIEPDWSSAFCTDPGLARSTRRTLMENIADTDSLLVPAHFRGSGRCRIKSRGNGFMPVLED